MNRQISRALGLILVSLTWAASPLFARAADAPGSYGVKAREVTEYTQKTFFDPKTGYYVRGPDEHKPDDRKPDYIWRQAAMVSVLVGAARHEPQTYRPLLTQYFHALDAFWDTKTAIPAYEPSPTRGNGHDKYYDDNAWLVITFAEAYQLTGDAAFLTRATEVARFVKSGLDDKLGGGIWWHQAHHDDSKNTCANGPGAVGFLAIARLGPKTDADAWRKAAIDTVAWTHAKLQDKDGLFDDRIIVTTGEAKRGKLTYNSALMLRANLDLYHQTGEARYLEEAKRIGKAADWFLGKDHVYRDPLKWSQFMVEADLALYRTSGETYLVERAKTNADAYYASWQKEKPKEMMANAGIARILWLLADTETEAGKAFWRKAEQRRE